MGGGPQTSCNFSENSLKTAAFLDHQFLEGSDYFLLPFYSGI